MSKVKKQKSPFEEFKVIEGKTNEDRKKEFSQCLADMDSNYAIFTTIAHIGWPQFREDVGPTACIRFDRTGRSLDFIFNPAFWDNLSDYERKFVICHECLHIILNHGKRMIPMNPLLANAALDVAVNHLLLSNFNFDRSKLDVLGKNGCWVDTTFNGLDPLPEDDHSSEYYHNLLLQNTKFVNISFSFDSHDGLSELPEDLLKEIADKVFEKNSPEEVKRFIEKIKSTSEKVSGGFGKDVEEKKEEGKGSKKGSGEKETGGTSNHNPGGIGIPGDPLIPGTLEEKLKVGKPAYKNKWQTVVKLKSSPEMSLESRPTWVYRSPRHAILDKKMHLPFERRKLTMCRKKKTSVVMFLDCSGSCSHLKERFLTAAKTLDPKYFEVELYGRTTEVFPIKDDTVIHGGSDDYQCMEDFIQDEIKKGKRERYPEAIFHITDGGDCSESIMRPEKPERWYFFLTEGGHTDRLPKGCNIYNLADFE